MANRKTLDFLPKTFQTETNEKFLKATLDQLISEPDFVKLNGYVGRKFSPTYKPEDSYVFESDNNRKNYQLEPSVVVSESDDIKFYSNYVDLINKLEYYGAKVNNHDRLFSSEYYSFGGLIDLDKFINFSQYYWLPNGPDPILIGTSIIKSHQTFILTRDEINNAYNFDDLKTKNPEITLMRGGRYKFKVSQPGSGFWIQTEPGISGTKKSLPTVGTREVFGVTNNGEDDGEVEFFVPLASAQDEYLKMPIVAVVDFAVAVTFASLDGASILNLNLDGIGLNPNEKTIIFTTDSQIDEDWYSISQDKIIEPDIRRSVWQISVDNTNPENPTIKLRSIIDIKNESRIYVRTGIANAHTEFIKNSSGILQLIPVLTAQSDDLYYQDAAKPDMWGRIRLVDRVVEAVDVEEDIIGKEYWENSAGVELSNGMKIQFGEYVTPTKYANRTYIVEGVGDSIVLVDYSLLVSPESKSDESLVGWDIMKYDVDNLDESYAGPNQPEYIVSNRTSLDLNAWARQNCWYHISILESSAKFNGTEINIAQSARARRPIIEFQPSIQLFNSGSIGMRPVDHIDIKYQNAFNQIQHSKTLDLPDLKLSQGQRVLFANDTDPLVRTQVYTVDYGIQDEAAEEAYYDLIGSGILQSKPVYIDFKSRAKLSTVNGQRYNPNTPNLNLDYSYTWAVISNNEIMRATVIEGIEMAAGSPDAVITSVEDLGDKKYLITFRATVPIFNFVNYNIKIRGPDGSKEIIGEDTKFLSEVTPGSKIYDVNDVYIGTVSVIHSDTSMFLENTTDYVMINAGFKVKSPRVRLVLSDDSSDIATIGSQIVAKNGVNRGVSFWYNGSSWTKAQLKTFKNQHPVFDVFDVNGNSLSSKDLYPASSFSGTKIFSYKIGNGKNDQILGFPLYYTTSSSTAAEITFENNIESDIFTYLVKSKTQKSLISRLGTLRKNITSSNQINVGVWNLISEKSKQYQIISTSYTGNSNNFLIDITPEPSASSPNIRVFLNNSLLSVDSFSIKKVNSISTVEILKKIMKPGDNIDILIYSKDVSKLGYYQIPPNLEYNSENVSLSTLNLGQIRNHLSKISQNIIDNSDPTNLINLNISNVGGNILQHTAPIIYSSLFLLSEQANFINALEYSKQEYVKFKNKFLELITTLTNQNQLDITVDVVLGIINQNKNNSFPWYYSDMVPYGDHKIISYKITDSLQRQYRIDSDFSLTELQSRAILVYYNGEILLHGIDYVFSELFPAVIINDTYDLTINALLEIKEYNTDGNFIPETPTKLGLYPKFLPEIFLDSTYQTPTLVIKGHDGSITPAFNDIKDRLLLELEIRIYNNIKKNKNSQSIDINEFIPGQFRSVDYSLEEYNNILSSSFLKWAGNNRLDYTSNDYVVNSQLFSYNYKNSKNKLSNQASIGYWRGIYKFLYDTDMPHSQPWEMLGFCEKPDWWQKTYGPAPYTSNNLNLWSDLENGIIRHGSRAGIDKKYIRNGLLKVIPVDDQGNLLPPTSVSISKFNSNRISDSFSFGDHGPVETAWRKSSEYPFAIQKALALMKPAFYFGTLFDVNSYFKDSNTGQYINLQNNSKVTPESIRLNGEIVESTPVRASGYLNFILAHLANLGIDPFNTIRNLLNNVIVRLSYKMAGYSDKKYLTILAEQYSPTSTNESIVIPDENYNVYLNKGSPVQRATYSAVIIEKTENGYSVSGYNNTDPHFIIIPSETSANDNYTINVGPVSTVIFNKYKKEKILVPYGQEFTNRQQVVDFLISYQRYLMSLGFVFDSFNDDLKEQQNWILSAKEFLTWTLQSWKLKSILVLSPVGSKLSLFLNNKVVDDLSNESNSVNVLDTNFNIINIETLFVNRKPGFFSMESTNGDTFAFVQLNLIEFEHVLIFDNTTIFNDVIYRPELGSRQFRLKLVGSKTGGWSGEMSPPGFVFNNGLPGPWQPGRDYLKGDLVGFKSKYYVATQGLSATDSFNLNNWSEVPQSSIKTGLLPNWSQNASKFIDVYDIDSEFADKQFRKLSAGLIGYRFRNYLTDLNVDITSQTKFYQGFIKEKGTKNAIYSLLAASDVTKKADITFNEEWAIKVGEYGAQNSNGILDVVVDEAQIVSNNFGLLIDDSVDLFGFVSGKALKEYTTDRTAFPGFLIRNNESIHDNDIHKAGYVNLDDIDFSLFDIVNDSLDLTSLKSVVSGMHLWVAKDLAYNWQVYLVNNSDNYIKSIEYALDMRAIVTTSLPNNLAINEFIIIKQLHDLLDGIYMVLEVLNSNKFIIEITQDQVSFLKQGAFKSIGTLLLLKSVRFNNMSSVLNSDRQVGWSNRTKIWVDSDSSGGWAFYKKIGNWDLSRKISLEVSNNNEFSGYGSSISVSPNQQFVSLGSPDKNGGSGRLHIVKFDGDLYRINAVDPRNNDIKSFGFSLDMSNDYLVTGAPKFKNDLGFVAVCSLDKESDTHNVTQIIQPPDNTDRNLFGTSVSLSSDSKILYIGSPGNKSVYKYTLVNFKPSVQYIQFSPIVDRYQLKSVFSSQEYADYFSVDINEELLIKGVDYTVFFNQIVLSQEKFLEYQIKPYPVTITIKLSSYYKYSGVKLSSGTPGNKFGQCVRLSKESDILIVGAPLDIIEQSSIPTGSAYVFKSDTQIQRLIPDQNNFRSNFGISIDCSKDGNKVYIGAPNHNELQSSDGAVFCYTKTGQNYEIVQKLTGPTNRFNQQFGYRVKLSPTEKSLLISSLYGSTKNFETVDQQSTIFDSDNTKFYQGAEGTGCVYLYEMIDLESNSFINTSEFSDGESKTGDGFGNSIDITKNYIFIGSRFNTAKPGQVGQIYEYFNSTGTNTWVKTRSQNDLVDISSINSINLFNKNTGEVLASLDYIDPAKGKILGIVDQDLGYRTSVDPAVYNSGSSNPNLLDYSWGSSQIGKTWWDLSQVRYIDYEQSDLSYRLKTWGQVFPGSKIHVYEWIESSVPPSRHVSSGNPGIPYSQDDREFSTVEYINPQSKIVIVKYYYWARSLNKIPSNVNRSMSVAEMELAISNPTAQNIPYVGFLSNNSLALFNCQSYFSGKTTTLRINYDKTLNSNLAHSEYALVSDGNTKSKMPESIIDKMIDSLSGVDHMGEIVPDQHLTPEFKIGTQIKPRQTLIVNKLEALRNIVGFINSMLSSDSTVLAIQNNPEFKNSRLNVTDQLPNQFNYKVSNREELSYLNLKNNDKVLVVEDSYYDNIWTLHQFKNGTLSLIKNQTFNTKKFWRLKEWYATGYSSNMIINFVVDRYSTIDQLTLEPGNTVKVLSSTGFEIYYFDTPTSSRLIGLEYGSIEFLDSIWHPNNVGFDNNATDQTGFDGNNSIEIRQILNALRYEILIGNLEGIFNQMIFALINYVLSEQHNLDWAFKTSFISVLHNIRSLEQTPNFVKDNQNYYIDYINEVKPYRTKIKDYLPAYSTLDLSQVYSTDFDLPGAWDSDLNMYRSPTGEYPIKDGELLLSPQYQDWRKNLYFELESIKIVNPGFGFLSDPKIKIVSVDGFGSGATAVASVNRVTGTIFAMTVTNPGSGYINPPQIIVNGDGHGFEFVPIMSNKKVRSFLIVLKFDRISYTTQVTEWNSNKSYKFGSLVSYQGKGYRANATVPAYNLFNYALFDVIPDSDYISANDRIASIYRPDYYQPEKEFNSDGAINLSRLIPGVIRDASTDDGQPLGFGDDLSKPLERYIRGDQPDYVVSGGQSPDGTVNAPEELVPGITFENLCIKVLTKIQAVLYFDTTNLLSYSGGDTIYDISGYNNTGKISMGNITQTPETVDNINVIEFPDNQNTKIDFTVQRIVESNAQTITIEMWANVKSFGGGMFFGWLAYDVWSYQGALGFNTANNDLYGISLQKVQDLNLENRWAHYVFVMSSNGDYRVNEIYIDGVKQTLSQQHSKQDKSNVSFNNGEGRIGGWRRDDGYRQEMNLGIFAIYELGLTQEEITRLFDDKKTKFGFNSTIQSDNTNGLAYRMFIDNTGNPDYFAMTRLFETTLSQDLNWNDEEIHVNDVSKLSIPDVVNNIPGTIYIAGEKIRYFTIDKVNNTVGQLLRGVDKTGVPEVHLAATKVEDIGNKLLIPSSITTNTQQVTFSAIVRKINTTFAVSRNLNHVRNNLKLKIGRNILPLMEYYTLTNFFDPNIKSFVATISFTKIALDRIVDGITITITYDQERIWLTPGQTTVADGLGLVMSNTTQAKFLRTLPY
jgi:hypothetical protein